MTFADCNSLHDTDSSLPNQSHHVYLNRKSFNYNHALYIIAYFYRSIMSCVLEGYIFNNFASS